MQGDGQQGRRGLLTRGRQLIEFAVIGRGRRLRCHFLGQGEEAVGFAAHGAGHDHHLVPGAVPLGDPLGDVADALGRAHAGAAVFVNYQCHVWKLNQCRSCIRFARPATCRKTADYSFVACPGSNTSISPSRRTWPSPTLSEMACPRVVQAATCRNKASNCASLA